MAMLHINGVKTFYVIRGEGTPIIFIHPPLLSSVNFIYQLAELSSRFKTIAYDIRGHGRSQSSDKELTYSLLVEDIKLLMDQLEIDCAFLCGYSTGGSIALEFLLTYPERSLGAILIGSMSEVHDMRLQSKIYLGRTLAKMGAMSLLAFTVSWANSNKRDLFWKMFKLARQGDHKNIEQYYTFSMQYNCSSRLPRIQHPVLLVYGSKDKSFHSYGKLLHTQLPNNKIVFIQNVSHQIPTKANAALNNVITKFIEDETNGVSAL